MRHAGRRISYDSNLVGYNFAIMNLAKIQDWPLQFEFNLLFDVISFYSRDTNSDFISYASRRLSSGIFFRFALGSVGSGEIRTIMISKIY